MNSFLSISFFFITVESALYEKTCREQEHIANSVGQSFGLLMPIKKSSRFTCLSICQFVSFHILHINLRGACNRAYNHTSSECRLMDLPLLKKRIENSADRDYDSRITVPFKDYCQHLCEIHPNCYAAETASRGHRGYDCNLIHRSLVKPKPSVVCRKRRCTTFICEKTAHNMLNDFHR